MALGQEDGLSGISGLRYLIGRSGSIPMASLGDDWLHLSEDTAKDPRNPRSSVAQTHLKMNKPTRQSTTENYMLMLSFNQPA